MCDSAASPLFNVKLHTLRSMACKSACVLRDLTRTGKLHSAVLCADQWCYVFARAFARPQTCVSFCVLRQVMVYCPVF